MKLGLNLGYWGAGNYADNIVLAQEADRIGYSVVWAAEAYGSDAVTVLSWMGALTQHVDPPRPSTRCPPGASGWAWGSRDHR
jgi:alkanesulfonate monooxygenase SsuD/methylene tetrahydromethanopterin reductase-like flavin-dependent oxidoreductase (luciferase family)